MSTTKVPRLELVSPKSVFAGLDPEIIRFRKKAILGLLVLVFLLIPSLNLLGVIEPHILNRLGRYLCFGIAALGIDLIWGYAGVLSLCHALFFCLGGYAIGMHLSLPEAGGDVRPEYHNIPQFFFFNNVDTLPTWWRPFASLPFSLLAAFVLPAVVAGVVGFFIFRNRVRGVYFSIITQALAWGAFLAFSRNEMLLGGTNGLTNFFKPLNSDNTWILGFYLLTATMLVGAFSVCRHITSSRLGKVLIAVRDNETRLYFLGYRPDLYKAFAFVVAAMLAALGGMLYVPQNGIITPNVMRVEDSIWMVIWVAVGGRGRLWGAVAGALLANFTYSALTSDMPKAWPFIQASLFLGALAFPSGVSELWNRLESDIRGGARIWRVLVAFGFLELGFIADKLGYLPSLGGFAFIGIQVRYWILLAITLVLSFGRVAHASIPLFGILWFLVTEAFGLMPSSFTTMKYVLVMGTFVIFAYLQGNIQAWIKSLVGRLRKARRKEAATAVGGMS